MGKAMTPQNSDLGRGADLRSVSFCGGVILFRLHPSRNHTTMAVSVHFSRGGLDMSQTRLFAAVLGMLVMASLACSAATSTPAPTLAPPTNTPAPTLAPPTNTPAPTKTPLPTLTPTPALPTYSQVLRTYPANTNLCRTDADITGGDDNGLDLRGTISMRNNQFVYQCYGTKLTVTVTVTLEGKTYKPGTKLTVDKNLKWVEVSSWD